MRRNRCLGKGFTNPNNLIQGPELLIRETKAGQDGLNDEMLNISKQLLSMNLISQEQLDFFFNYDKWKAQNYVDEWSFCKADSQNPNQSFL